MTSLRNAVGAGLVFIASLGGNDLSGQTLDEQVQLKPDRAYSVSKPTQSSPSNYGRILTEESRPLSESGWEIPYSIFELGLMALGAWAAIKYEEKSGIILEERKKQFPIKKQFFLKRAKK